MATTRESFEDGLRWLRDLVKIGIRRGIILGIFVALFAGLVVITTREKVSDCGDVAATQRAVLGDLAEGDPLGSLIATGEPTCVDGELTISLEGFPRNMVDATELLTSQGWVLETTYVGYSQQLWRHCFSRDALDWESIHLTIDADRGGTLIGVNATAIGDGTACATERREVSEIYPPRS